MFADEDAIDVPRDTITLTSFGESIRADREAMVKYSLHIRSVATDEGSPIHVTTTVPISLLRILADLCESYNRLEERFPDDNYRILVALITYDFTRISDEIVRDIRNAASDFGISFLERGLSQKIVDMARERTRKA